MSSPDDVRSFVYGIIDIFPGPLRTVGRWVADRVFGVWTEIYRHLVGNVDPFRYFRERFHWLMLTIVEHANQITASLRWLAGIYVPRWARWAGSEAYAYALRAINAVRDYLRGIIATLQTWAQRAINAVDAFAHNAWRWVTQHVQEIWATLTRIRDLALKMLTSPEYLVDWFFAALWRRFWKYVNDHAESIAAAWWRARGTLILKSLARVESFLARIL